MEQADFESYPKYLQVFILQENKYEPKEIARILRIQSLGAISVYLQRARER